MDKHYKNTDLFITLISNCDIFFLVGKLVDENDRAATLVSGDSRKKQKVNIIKWSAASYLQIDPELVML